jgi:AraC-like DNA-binding protein
MMRETVRTLQHNPDSAVAFLDVIRDSYGEQMTYNEKVTFYNLRGAVHAWQNELETAETYYLRALQFAEKLNDGNLLRQAVIANNVALSRMNLGNLPGALEAFRQTRTLLGNQNPERLLAVYIDKGGVFAAMGNTDSALYYIGLAIATAVEVGFRGGEAVGLMNLAAIFFNLGNYRQAEENYRQAALIFEEIDDRRNLMITYNNLSGIAASQNRLEESLLYARKSDEIAAAIGTPATAMHSYYARRGQMYLEEGNYNSSLEMFYRSLALRTQWQDIRMMAQSKSSISAVYGQLGDFDRAIYYASEALRIAHENGISHLQLEIYRNLLFIHAMRGDMDSFAAAMEAEQTLRDALFAEQSNRALHEMQVRYETERREMLIAQQEEEIRHKRSTIALLITIGIIVIVMSVLIVLFLRMRMQSLIRIVQQHETITKYERESAFLHSENADKFLQDLKYLFEEKEIYRQKGLNKSDVSKAIGTNQNYLSQLINNNFRKSFNEFVNDYRIREAKRLLKEQSEGGEYADYTIQTLAEMVGFSGTTRFYAAFKQTVGVTPAEYKKVKKMQIKEEKSHVSVEEAV